MLLIALVLTFIAVAPWRAAEAADLVEGAPAPAAAAQSEELPSENDDTVAVQLTVLGIVLGAVFVAGTGAYLLRRRLGLTAYTRPADSGHH